MRKIVVAMVLVGGVACATPPAKTAAAPPDPVVPAAGGPPYRTEPGPVRTHHVWVGTVSLGQPQVNGDLDTAIIRRYIKRNIDKLAYCYEKQLLETPTLEGTVTADFTIATDGTVSSSSAVGITAMQTCVTDLIKSIEFPKPGTGVTVTYPFNFSRQ